MKEITDNSDLNEKERKYLELKLTQEECIDSFLEQFKNEYTKRTYKAAFKRIKDYCAQKNILLLNFTPTIADEWIRYEIETGRAPASVRKDVATISSFFTYMEKKLKTTWNPFRGTKARPKLIPTEKILVPDKKDYETIIRKIPEDLSVVIQFIAVTGLRAGAFETLCLKDNVLQYEMNDKIHTLPVTAPVENLINEYRLNPEELFPKWKAHKIENLLRYYTKLLYTNGIIKAVYSADDFRNYFAINEYSKNKDIYKLSRLLNHSSLLTTQKFLSSLNIEIQITY
ncbi:MAG: site-specific integrase [Treponemataceae bacterium]|nr:site-specific integrase [Treponemataceae bacterium]